MKADELVDGAEYEGDSIASQKLIRGAYRADYQHAGGGDTVTIHPRGKLPHWVMLDSLRPISSTPAIAEKDRLFEGEFNCALCGSDKCTPDTPFGANDIGLLGGPFFKSKRRVCAMCRDGVGRGDWHRADQEVMRRKALAANTQPAESNRYARRCDKCTNPVVADATLCKEHSASLGKPVRDKAEPKCIACNRNAPAGHERCVYCAHRHENHLSGKETVLPGRLSDVDDRIAQAKRQLDAARPRKYPYADSSVVFSSATWESD
jgi:hypothetical protein